MTIPQTRPVNKTDLRYLIKCSETPDFKPLGIFITGTVETLVGISRCLSSLYSSIQIGERVLSNGIFAVIHLFKLSEGIILFAEAERF